MCAWWSQCICSQHTDTMAAVHGMEPQGMFPTTAKKQLRKDIKKNVLAGSGAL